jgi:hypothetical protein
MQNDPKTAELIAHLIARSNAAHREANGELSPTALLCARAAGRLLSLQAAEAKMREALRQSAAWFRDYEQQHEAKGTQEGRDKAAVNAARAVFCEGAAALSHQPPRAEKTGGEL